MKLLREEIVKKEEPKEEIIQGYHRRINDQSSSPGCCCPLVVLGVGVRPAEASMVSHITWAVTPFGEPARKGHAQVVLK